MQAGKYGYIRPDDHLGDIPPDEPVFIIRAQDSTALFMLEYYTNVADEAGAPEGHLEMVGERIEQFRTWQANNKIKVPGT